MSSDAVAMAQRRPVHRRGHRDRHRHRGSIVTFDTLAAATVALALYLLLTTIEANFVTPLILSRRLTLNPVVVLLGLLFWGWIWGIPGALLNVPLLVTLRILCDYVPSLHVLGKFLGD